jgi:hypothetical protein
MPRDGDGVFFGKIGRATTSVSRMPMEGAAGARSKRPTTNWQNSPAVVSRYGQNRAAPWLQASLKRDGHGRRTATQSSARLRALFAAYRVVRGSGVLPGMAARGGSIGRRYRDAPFGDIAAAPAGRGPDAESDCATANQERRGHRVPRWRARQSAPCRSTRKPNPQTFSSPDLTGPQVSMHFNRACRRLGIADFRFHDLRHTAVSWLRMKGADIHTVAQLDGCAVSAPFASVPGESGGAVGRGFRTRSYVTHMSLRRRRSRLDWPQVPEHLASPAGFEPALPP